MWVSVIASASVDLMCRTVKKFSSGLPLTNPATANKTALPVYRYLSTHLPIEKNGLDIGLVSKFLSSHVSMASISNVTLNLEVY